MTTYEIGQVITGEGVAEDNNFPRTETAKPVHAGLSAIWQQIVPELKRLVAALGCGQAVEDILQDVYLAAMQKRPQAVDELSLRRWLFRVTINRCHLENRKRGLRRKMLSKLARLFHREKRDRLLDDKVAQNERHREVQSALEGLDELDKAPLVLRYFQGMSSIQIAEILEIPDSTVRSRLRRARMKLADTLRKKGY